MSPETRLVLELVPAALILLALAGQEFRLWHYGRSLRRRLQELEDETRV